MLVKRRKATRLLSAPSPEPLGISVRTFGDTALVQNADELLVPVTKWRCVTPGDALGPAAPGPQHRVAGLCTHDVQRHRASRATVSRWASGAGQQSRVVAAGIATAKAGEFARRRAAASDAFFPFADGLESLTSAGVTAVVQPGGSVRDQEVIDAANAAGIVMMLTGERHFRH